MGVRRLIRHRPQGLFTLFAHPMRCPTALRTPTQDKSAQMASLRLSGKTPYPCAAMYRLGPFRVTVSRSVVLGGRCVVSLGKGMQGAIMIQVEKVRDEAYATREPAIGGRRRAAGLAGTVAGMFGER